MTPNLRRSDAPLPACHHSEFMVFLDQFLAMRTFELGLIWQVDACVVFRPDDVRPHDLSERAALRTRDLEDALVGLAVGAEHVTRVDEDRRRADDDLAVAEGLCPLFRQ